MSEPILDPKYWERRLTSTTTGNLHHSIFRCQLEEWRRIETKHRMVLTGLIHPRDSILDAGCGYGRLLTLLPETWKGHYLGVDIAPAFINLAKNLHSDRSGSFVIGSLLDLNRIDEVRASRPFDWAVMISIRPMVQRNLGEEVWNHMEQELKSVSRRLLYLEYDETDPGEVVACRDLTAEGSH